MKNPLILFVLVLGIACLVFGLIGTAISANTSDTAQAIAQIEAQRSVQQIVSGFQTTITVLVVAIVLLVLAMVGLGIALVLKNRKPAEVQGQWKSGPGALWGRKPQPQLTEAELFKILLLQQMTGQLPAPKQNQPAEEDQDWFGGMFG